MDLQFTIKRICRLFLAAILVNMAFSAHATRNVLPLGDDCVVNILNRTVQADMRGRFFMDNVPSFMGQIRARATCVRNGATLSAESEYFNVLNNDDVNVGSFFLADADAVPTALLLSGGQSVVLTGEGDKASLKVLARYRSGKTEEVTAAVHGTNYSLANNSIASVSANGLVTAKASGSSLLTVRKDGVVAVATVTVVTSGDTDGDGIPDDVEIANGLDPNDPVDGYEDQDGDGLTAREEFFLGTNIHLADTDGDGISDGEEVIPGVNGVVTNPLLADTDGDGVNDGLEISLGTDPNDPNSVDFSTLLTGLTIIPDSALLFYNTIDDESSLQLTVTGGLIDGSSLNLTNTVSGTAYSSSDLEVVNFGAEPGKVFAGQDGVATVTAVNGGHGADSVLSVATFAPTPLGFIELPAEVTDVVYDGTYAYVASAQELFIVDMTDPAAPFVGARVSLDRVPVDIKVDNGHLYLASVNGVEIYSLGNPLQPLVLDSLVVAGGVLDMALDNRRLYIGSPSGLLIYDVASPESPALLGEVSSLSVKAVAASADLVVVVTANDQVVSIAVGAPSQPVIGVGLRVPAARKVALRGRFAYLAAQTAGYPSIDFSDIFNPLLRSNFRDFPPTEVAIAGDHAFYADLLFSNAILVVNVKDPQAPVFQTVFDLSAFGNDRCNSVSADFELALCTAQNRLYIVRYRQQQDLAGIAPAITWQAPAAGSVLQQGRPYRVRFTVEDDIRVAAVNVFANNQRVFSTTSPPYEFIYTVPEGIEQAVFRVEAIDLAGNTGTHVRTFDALPLTTLDEVWTDSFIDFFDEDLIAQNVTMDSASFISVFDLSVVGDLRVGGDGDSTIFADRLDVGGDLVVDGVSLILRAGNGISVLGDVRLLNGARLLSVSGDIAQQQIYPLRLDVAGNIEISQDSMIDVSGTGYPANRLGWPDFTANNHWGCHGGVSSVNQDQSCVYGRLERARFAGSGASATTGAPASGGGVIDITATNIALYGGILANGMSGNGATGGGAGGAVHISARAISGMGSIEARGGRGGVHSGGGGRISLYVDDIAAHTGAVRADGHAGGAGTIYIKRSSDAFGELIVDNFGTSSARFGTSVRQVGEHRIVNALPFSPGVWHITVDGAAWQATDLALDRGVQGKWVSFNADDSNAQRYRIEENGVDYLVVHTDDNLFDVVGNNLVGVHIFDRLSVVNGGWLDIGADRFLIREVSNSRIANGGTLSTNKLSQAVVELAFSSGGVLVSESPLEIYALNTSGQVPATISAPSLTVLSDAIITGQQLILDLPEGFTVNGDLSLTSGAVLTVPSMMEVLPFEIFPLSLTVAGELFVDSASRIDLDGKGWGHQGRNGPVGVPDLTPIGCHGGSIRSTPGCEYGRYAQARFAGSGINANRGGGLAEIEANNILLNGVISANGIDGTSVASGGSGGGLHIETPLLSGAGELRVEGATSRGDPGAGGRLSLLVADSSGFIGRRSAAGSINGSRTSGAGTVFERHPSEAYGHLLVANDGIASDAGLTRIEHVGRHRISGVTDLGNGRWEVSVVPPEGVREDGQHSLVSGGIAYHRFTVGVEQEITFRVDADRSFWGAWLHRDTGSFDSSSQVANWSAQRYESLAQPVTLLPGDYVFSMSACDKVTEAELAVGSSCTGRPELNYRLRLDSPAQWRETDLQAEWGIQGLQVSLDEADALAPLYRVARNDRSWFEIETTDDLSGYLGRELIGVHTFETLQVQDGASVDFGGDRLRVNDKGNSDFSGELLNINLTDDDLVWFSANLPEGGRLDLDQDIDMDNLTISRQGMSFDNLRVSDTLTISAGGVAVKGALNAGTVLLDNAATLESLDTSVETLSLNGSTLTTEALSVNGDLSLTSGAVLTVPSMMEVLPFEIFPLSLTVAGELFVDSASRIDLDGKGWGHQGRNGPVGVPDLTPIGCHGGSIRSTPGCEYGRYAQARFAGSGINANRGGGLAEIEANNILLNGVISANGIDGTSVASGGSGGGLHIETPLLSGAGELRVEGATSRGDPGAGGRLSLLVADSSGFIGRRSAAGSINGSRTSGAGTVFERHPSEAYGHLLVANDGIASDAGLTRIEHVGRHRISGVTDLGNGRWEVSVVPPEGVREDGQHSLVSGGIAYHRFTVGVEQEITFRVDADRSFWGAWLHRDTGSFDSSSQVANWSAQRYESLAQPVTLLPGDYVFSMSACDKVTEAELAVGSSCTGRPELNYRLRLDSPAQWRETDLQAEWGIQGLQVSLDEADALAPLYRVARNDRSWFEIETTDDLSGYLGRELIGVHTFETLQVKDGASADFGGDRLRLLDSAGSDLSGEILNATLAP